MSDGAAKIEICFGLSVAIYIKLQYVLDYIFAKRMYYGY